MHNIFAVYKYCIIYHIIERLHKPIQFLNIFYDKFYFFDYKTLQNIQDNLSNIYSLHQIIITIIIFED